MLPVYKQAVSPSPKHYPRRTFAIMFRDKNYMTELVYISVTKWEGVRQSGLEQTELLIEELRALTFLRGSLGSAWIFVWDLQFTQLTLLKVFSLICTRRRMNSIPQSFALSTILSKSEVTSSVSWGIDGMSFIQMAAASIVTCYNAEYSVL